MRIIRAADCRRMPWKNGGGETTEIATFPEGAGLEGFTWRLSAARVAQDGPFSTFPGVDRTLAVLSGEGLELRLGTALVRLGSSDAPLSFSGDQPTEARLIGDVIEDLNVMTRRGMARHAMQRFRVEGPTTLPLRGGTVLAFCGEGRVALERKDLAARDTLLMTTQRGRSLAVDGQGTLYVVSIEMMPHP